MEFLKPRSLFLIQLIFKSSLLIVYPYFNTYYRFMKQFNLKQYWTWLFQCLFLFLMVSMINVFSCTSLTTIIIHFSNEIVSLPVLQQPAHVSKTSNLSNLITKFSSRRKRAPLGWIIFILNFYLIFLFSISNNTFILFIFIFRHNFYMLHTRWKKEQVQSLHKK